MRNPYFPGNEDKIQIQKQTDKYSYISLKWLLVKWKKLFPPGIEPGTLRVWGARDNHYTTETDEENGVYTEFCMNWF